MKSKLVLLAEDHHTNQRVTKFLLEKLGLEVHVVSSGRDAVTVATRNSYDLILMDVRMPVIDGLKATEEIRASEELTGRHTPIVALTASAMPGDRERCIQAGMDDYLSLPFTQRELTEIIESWLKTDWQGSQINSVGDAVDAQPGP